MTEIELGQENWLADGIRLFVLQVRENEDNEDIREAFRVFDRDGDG